MGVVPEEALEQVERFLGEERYDAASELCQTLLCRDPDNVEVLFLSGNIAFRGKEWGMAIFYFREACRLDPANPVLLNNLGLAMLKGTQSREPIAGASLDEAARTFEKALHFQPDYVIAWKNLGIVRREQGDTDGARSCFTQGLTFAPNDSALWLNMGMLYTATHYYDLAIDCYRRILRLDPVERADVLNRLATLYGYIGKIPEAIATFEKAIALAPIREQQMCYASNLLFTLHYLPAISPEEIAGVHRKYGETYFSGTPAQCPANNPDPHRRLRVGYVSPDLRMNAVLFFIQPVLAAHDAAQVEVFCYANVKTPDLVTAQLREKHPVVWRDIFGLDDDKVLHLIRNDGIDILVDLAGHGGENRLSLFNLRPAPVQVSWIGYPDTTGLPAMDYRITDAKADPPGMTEHLHTEELVRLPRTFLCYNPGGDFPSEGPLPFLANRFVTFGTMSNFSKINAPLLDIWCEILTKVPASRLVLRYRGQERERLNRELSEHLERKGIGAERLLLLGHARSVVEQMQAYHMIDIALDTFPYNGTTTTCEALYMGVPVVTLAGHSHVARVGASLLETAGLPELVAESAGEYVEKAVILAGDLKRLLHLRKGLRRMLMSSPLTDNVTFTVQVEQLYRQMWQRWCREHGHQPTGSELLS
jgi:protein O-GlcNAc transferase